MAAAHVAKRGGRPLSPPVVAGSASFGLWGAGGISPSSLDRNPCSPVPSAALGSPWAGVGCRIAPTRRASAERACVLAQGLLPS